MEKPATGKFWPEGWWRLMEFRIGIIPLPVFVLMGALIAGFVDDAARSPPRSPWRSWCSRSSASCSPRSASALPVLRNIGAAAIFATFIPSALVYYKILPESIIKMTTDFTKTVQLPLPLHRLDHRRQHPQHGPRGADQGLREDLRPARGRLDRGDDRRHAGRHGARAGRAPHVLLHRGADHGRRRGRRRDPALGRLRRDPAPGPGRALRDRAAARDAGQPHRDPPVGHC